MLVPVLVKLVKRLAVGGRRCRWLGRVGAARAGGQGPGARANARAGAFRTAPGALRVQWALGIVGGGVRGRGSSMPSRTGRPRAERQLYRASSRVRGWRGPVPRQSGWRADL